MKVTSYPVSWKWECPDCECINVRDMYLANDTCDDCNKVFEVIDGC